MTGRERFTAALRRPGVPDRVPVAPAFQGYWALDTYGVTVPRSLADPRAAADAVARAQEDCPFDALEVVWDWFAFIDLLGCTSKITDVGGPSVETSPLGSSGEVDGLEPVDTAASERVQASLATAGMLLERFGDQLFCYATLPLPFTLAGHLRGVGGLMTDLVTAPADTHRLLEYSTRVLLDHLSLYRGIGLHGFVMCDPTASGDLISPRHYEAFAAPYTNAVIRAIEEHGLPCILHVCGKTAGILSHVADMAPTAFSFDSAVDVASVKAAIGNSVALLGNVDPVGTLLGGTPEDVRSEAERCVAAGWADGGYVLAAGCDLCPKTPLENIRAMIGVAREAAYR